MLDKHKTKEQLLLELSEMRQRVNQIEKLHKEYFLTKDKLYESEKKHQNLKKSIKLSLKKPMMLFF
jgi:hypothetical protein